MFADDTNISTLGSSLPEIENKTNNDLHDVNSWLETNKLTLNAKKTEFMLIASKRKLTQLTENPNIYISNHNIKQVSKKKVLGILLEKELKWKEHNNAQCKTLSKSIALLKRAKCFVTYEVLIKMYNSLVLPHFTYCSNVWNDGSCAHKAKLYRMQKRAARIVTGCSYETRSREIFERLGWEPTKDILKKREIIIVFKALKGALPASLCEKFSLKYNDKHHLQSNNFKLYLRKPKTNFMKKSNSYRGASTWNSLPSNIVDNYASISTTNFKNLITKYFNDHHVKIEIDVQYRQSEFDGQSHQTSFTMNRMEFFF